MKVNIKKFQIQMEIKNKGMELEVRDTDGTHRGDIIISKTGLNWCEGKTSAANGKKVKWDDFIDWMNK